MTTLPRIVTVAALTALMLPGGARPARAAEPAESIYTRALTRERELRDESTVATASDLRVVVRTYEALVRLYPRSGYCDNSLWQAANLSLLAFERFGDALDRRTAVRLFTHLKAEYPTSAFAPRAADILRTIEGAATGVEAPPSVPTPPPTVPAVEG